jgi:hypothetical protein
MAEEALVSLKPAAFVPSISYAGDEPRYVIRGKGLWLKSKSEKLMYAQAYKGSRDIGETIPTKQITGTISWTNGQDTISGAGTLFRTEFTVGTFVSAPNGSSNTFFVIEEIISDTSARVSRKFTDSEAGRNAYIHPVMQALGQKRATMIRGNVAKFRAGHLLGVGDGTVKLNGQDLSIRQVEVMTVSTPSSAGANITVTATATGLTGSPLALSVAVLNGDTVTQVAAKIKAAMDANANITAFSEVAANGDKIYWIKKSAAANDVTMNLAITAAGGTGVTSPANSTNAVAGNTFALAKLPRYAMYNESSDVYTQVDFGIHLPTDTATEPIVTLGVSPTAGTKNMPNATFGVRVVAKSDPNAGSVFGGTTGGTGGYSQPSSNYTIATGATGKRIRLTFNKPMNIGEGQNAYDIYVTQYIDATSSAINNTQGPWYYYQSVTAQDLASFNSVSDGTVSGLFWDVEFADGELSVLNQLLSFDNFDPYDSEFVDLLPTESGITPIFFSCLGKKTAGRRQGTSPGPVLVPGKPDNPEAIMRDKPVSTFDGDNIVGVVNIRGRWWLLCENSLQTAILTGTNTAPITCRSFWDLGFRNRYNLKFFKDYAFGFSVGGFLRSISVGDTSDVDFDFSSEVDDYATDWICSHELTAYDPKNKAWLFMFSGKDKDTGFYYTQVVPYIPNQKFWNAPIILDGRGQQESNTIGGAAGATTNLVVTVKAAGVPALVAGKNINVAVVNGDSASTVAGKVRTGLNADSDVSGFFIIGGTGANYTITVKARAAQDTTMNLSHGAITGIAASATSTRTFVPVQDFIVSGVATVGQSLYFLAGGVTNTGTVQVKTYEFDGNDSIPVDCMLAWAYSDTDDEDTPQEITGIASAIGSFTSPKVEIHGVKADGIFDLATLENGHNDPLKTVTLTDTGSNITRKSEKRQHFESFSKWTARMSFTSLNGSGRLDELNLLMNENASRT